MTGSELVLRTATGDDFEGVYRLLDTAFAEPSAPDQLDVERLTFEPDRNHVITDGDEIVANAGVYTRDVTVPGAIVPCAHVTLVSVAPTYRRQGLLTRLMTAQLSDVARRGEPIAILWASEGAIYQRYGYGLASGRVMFEIQSSQLRLPPAAGEGTLRAVDAGTARPHLVDVYDRQRAHRTGLSSRPGRWWDARLADPQSQRKDTTPRRILLHEGASGVDGYALWRVKPEWDEGGPKGIAIVEELVAGSPEAYRSLWRFLLSVDLTRATRYRYGTVDEPLQYLVSEPRRLVGRLSDGLWLRIVDLPAALTARAYAGPVDAVIEVTDAIRPGNAGRWRLRAEPGGRAGCAPTDDPADLVLDVAALGAAYLGGTSLATLAAAGRVRVVDPAALAAASAAFGWHRPPAAFEVF